MLRTSSSILLPAFLVLLLVAVAQDPSTPMAVEQTSAVEVVALDDRGADISHPDLRVFESDDHKNFVSKFHDGIAEGVPFGVYRVEGHRAGYRSEIRYVSVYQSRVTVVLGFTFGYKLTDGSYTSSWPRHRAVNIARTNFCKAKRDFLQQVV
jgi:hypothetical protein